MRALMPPFRNDPSEWQRVDWRLFQNGFVHLFWSDGVLASTKEWLSADGYRVIEVDAGEWATTLDALDALAAALGFPDYFGRNLNALADCLGDVASFAYGSDEDSQGTALVLTHFDRYARREPDVAHAILDIFAGKARTGLLIGHRMLCLVQSDDPRISFDRVGSAAVMWNPAEFLNSKRQV
jgi:hypothetical protein